MRLALCQGVHNSGLNINLIFSAIIGYQIAPHVKYATVPLAMMFIASMLCALPISYMMFYIGRRAGFIICQLVGAFAFILATWAIIRSDFWLFSLSMALIGFHHSGGGFFRFAAAELADKEAEGSAGKAISLVIAGGVLAALLGPEIAKWSYDKIPIALYTGAYLSVTGLSFITIVLLCFIDFPRPRKREISLEPRPLLVMLSQPPVLMAIIAALVGYSMMTLLMTSTPLAMQGHAFHPAREIATVIQWHVFAMFAPGFFTGHLIKRFGVYNIIICGLVIYIFCAFVSLYDVQFVHFWVGLILLGVGWNFMYVGGTTMLSSYHEPHEKAKLQGFNDFCVSTSTATASLSSGFLFHAIGWHALNIIMLIIIVVTLLAFLGMRSVVSRQAA